MPACSTLDTLPRTYRPHRQEGKVQFSAMAGSAPDYVSEARRYSAAGFLFVPVIGASSIVDFRDVIVQPAGEPPDGFDQGASE